MQGKNNKYEAAGVTKWTAGGIYLQKIFSPEQ
jgi:hypothetical protein